MISDTTEFQSKPKGLHRQKITNVKMLTDEWPANCCDPNRLLIAFESVWGRITYWVETAGCLLIVTNFGSLNALTLIWQWECCLSLHSDLWYSKQRR